MTENNNTFIARDDNCYDRAMCYLIRRVVFLTTKVKRAVVEGNCLCYYDDADEEVARTNPGRREIRLTDKTDEETRLGLKNILGEGR